MKRRTIVGVAVLTAGLSFAGSCDKKGLGDAPIGPAYEAPRSVIVMHVDAGRSVAHDHEVREPIG